MVLGIDDNRLPVRFGSFKLFDSRKILMVFVVGAAITLTCGLFGSADVAKIAFPLCGFFLSVMWSIVISLGLNSVANHHGTLAGILCTGIVGGAVVPALIGVLSDVVGLRAAMFLIYLTLGYLFSMGIWAKPLVNNALRFDKRSFQNKKSCYCR
jgi:fucose permease